MRILGAILLAAMLAGCASATRGWEEDIHLASTPSGAEATLTTEPPKSCVTPCSIKVSRQADLTATFHKEGYLPQQVPLQKEIAQGGAVGFAGNLLLGGVVGMAVDGVSGAALDHKPNPVTVTLQPVGQPSRSQKPRPQRRGPAQEPAAPAAGM